MGNLQGVIRRLSVNTVSQFERLGGFSENLSNMNTPGYKTKNFVNVIDEEGYVREIDRRNHMQGSLRRTKNPMDVALDGSGFIPVTNKAGEILYTRDGHLTVDKDGILKTYRNEIVGDGIKIPVNYARLEIKKNGDVYTYETSLSEGKYHGTIPVVDFANAEGLEEAGSNSFRKTEESGEPMLAEGKNKVCQYHTEMANVDIFSEVNDVMRTNASLMAAQTLMTAIDKMYEKAINIRE